NMLFDNDAISKKATKEINYSIYEEISNKKTLQEKVLDHSLESGLIYINDDSGSNIDVQIIDLSKTNLKNTPFSGIKYSGDDVIDRKSTRLNSSHVKISYAVFCLKKK